MLWIDARRDPRRCEAAQPEGRTKAGSHVFARDRREERLEVDPRRVDGLLLDAEPALDQFAGELVAQRHAGIGSDAWRWLRCGRYDAPFAFQLLPRLKAIGTQKLYRPDKGEPDAYTNLLPNGLGATAASHLRHSRVRPERGCQVTRQSQFASRDLIASRHEWFVA
jgi:hypothetical protein